MNKVPMKLFSWSKIRLVKGECSLSLVSLVPFLVTGHPLSSLTSTVQWSGKGPYGLEPGPYGTMTRLKQERPNKAKR